MTAAPPNNGLAVASLACGIAALLPACCCLGPLGIPLSLLAVVLGWIAAKQVDASAGREGGKSLALAGLACGGVAIAFDLLGIGIEIVSQITGTLH